MNNHKFFKNRILPLVLAVILAFTGMAAFMGTGTLETIAETVFSETIGSADGSAASDGSGVGADDSGEDSSGNDGAAADGTAESSPDGVADSESSSEAEGDDASEAEDSLEAGEEGVDSVSASAKRSAGSAVAKTEDESESGGEAAAAAMTGYDDGVAVVADTSATYYWVYSEVTTTTTDEETQEETTATEYILTFTATLSTDATVYGEITENKKFGYQGDRGWNSYSSNITKVVFDESMAEIKPTSLAYWFYGFGSLTGFEGMKYLNTSACTSFRSTFLGCSSITELDLSGWDTSSATTFQSMFENCTLLTSVNAENWDVSKVTEMSSMFYNCSALKSVNFTGWSPTGITTLYQTFYGCTSLTELDFSNWGSMSALTTLYRTFYNCSSLTSVDFSGWNPTELNTLAGTFRGCSSLETITGIGDWNLSKVTSMELTFSNCQSLLELDLSSWGSMPALTTLSQTFYNCSALTSVDFSGWSPAGLTTLYQTFYNCKSLETVTGTGNWNFSAVTSMRQTFYNCASLTELNFSSSADLGSVTTLSEMFYGCSALTSLDLSGWGAMESVTTMYGMFYNCSSLIDLDTSDWSGTALLTTTENMFYGCSSLQTVELSQLDTSAVTTLKGMFYNCSSLTELDVSGWNTSSVTNMAGTFYNCSALAVLDVSDWDMSNVTSIGYTDAQNMADGMFAGCSSLLVLGVSKWDMSSCTNMAYAFYGCSSLMYLDVSGWDTSGVTSMHYMFSGCSSLTELDVSGFDVSKVVLGYSATGLSGMFSYCSSLESLDLSGWNPESLTGSGMDYMFTGCSSLQTLDMSGMDTTNITSMNQAFNGCTSLVSLTLGEKTKLTANWGMENSWQWRQMSSKRVETDVDTQEEIIVYDTKTSAEIQSLYSTADNAAAAGKDTFVREFDLTFYASGGSPTTTVEMYGYGIFGVDIVVTEPSRTGYDFAGWWTTRNGDDSGSELIEGEVVYYTYEDEDGNEETDFYVIPAGAEQSKENETEDATITQTVYYAHWTPHTYTLTLNANGGLAADEDGNSSVSLTIDMEYGEYYDLSDSGIYYDGYVLIGWSTSRNGEIIYEADEVIGNLTSVEGASVTLYARWESISNYAEVTYDVYGNFRSSDGLTGSEMEEDLNYAAGTPEGIDSELVHIGNTLRGYLPEAEWDGLTFVQWHLGTIDGDAVTRDTVITADMLEDGKLVLVAEWTDATRTLVSFYDGVGTPGSLYSEKYVDDGGSLGTLPTFSSGYNGDQTLYGWYVNIITVTDETVDSETDDDSDSTETDDDSDSSGSDTDTGADGSEEDGSEEDGGSDESDDSDTEDGTEDSGTDDGSDDSDTEDGVVWLTSDMSLELHGTYIYLTDGENEYAVGTIDDDGEYLLSAYAAWGWKPLFSAAGGTIASGTSAFKVQLSSLYTFTLPEASRDGYTFRFWTLEDGSILYAGVTYNADGTVTYNGTTYSSVSELEASVSDLSYAKEGDSVTIDLEKWGASLNAVWKQTDVITFYLNSSAYGINSEGSYAYICSYNYTYEEYDETEEAYVSVTDTVTILLTKDGDKYYDSDGNEVDFETTVSSDGTVSYTVNGYKAEVASLSESDLIVYYNSTKLSRYTTGTLQGLYDPTLDGYVFLGYAVEVTDSSGSTSYVTMKDDNGNAVYITNGMSVSEIIEYYEDYITSIYTFTYVYTYTDDDGNTVTGSATATSTDGITYYDDNGEKVSFTGSDGQAVTFTDSTDGQTLSGITDANGYTVTWVGGTSVSYSLTLCTVWQEKDITITYDAEGGTLYGSETENVVSGIYTGSVPGASLENYMFLGWFTGCDDSCTGLFETSDAAEAAADKDGVSQLISGVTDITDDVTYHAHYRYLYTSVETDDAKYTYSISWSNASTEDVDNTSGNLNFHPTSSADMTAILNVWFELSGTEEELAAGSIKVYVPAHVFTVTNEDGTVTSYDTADLSSQLPYYYELDEDGNIVYDEEGNPKIAESASDFSYYIETGDDGVEYYVIINNKAVTGGFKIDISYTVSPLDLEGGATDSEGNYVAGYDYYVNDNVQVRLTVDTGSGEDSNLVVDYTETLSLEMHTQINAEASKSYTGVYYSWESSWGDEPDDSEDYIYVIWELTADLTNISQSGSFYFSEDTAHDGTVVKWLEYSSGRYIPATETIVTYDDEGNAVTAEAEVTGNTSPVYTFEEADTYTVYVLMMYDASEFELLYYSEDIDLSEDGVTIENQAVFYTVWDAEDEDGNHYVEEQSVDASQMFAYIVPVEAQGSGGLGSFTKKNLTASIYLMYGEEGNQETLVNYGESVDLVWISTYNGITGGISYDADTGSYTAAHRKITIWDGDEGDLLYSDGEEESKYIWVPGNGNETLYDTDYEITGISITVTEYAASYTEGDGWSAQQKLTSIGDYGKIKLYVRYRNKSAYTLYQTLEITDLSEAVTVDFGEGSEIAGYMVVYETDQYRTTISVSATFSILPTTHITNLVGEDLAADITSIFKDVSHYKVEQTIVSIETDSDGEYVQETDDDGNPVYDENGEIVYATSATSVLLEGDSAVLDPDAADSDAENSAQWVIYELGKTTSYQYTAKYSSSSVQTSTNDQTEDIWIYISSWNYNTDGGTTYMKSGVFYDLLPLGTSVDVDTVFGMVITENLSDEGNGNRADEAAGDTGLYAQWTGEYTADEESYSFLDTALYSVTFEKNYNGTGRTMMIITWYAPEDVKITGMQFWYQLSTTFGDVQSYGATQNNVVAFVNTSTNVAVPEKLSAKLSSVSSDEVVSTAYAALQKEYSSHISYSSASVTYQLISFSSWTFEKKVMAESGLYSDEDTVSPGGTYTYLLEHQQDGTSTSNIVFVDVLEYLDENETSSWHGTLLSVDTSNAASFSNSLKDSSGSSLSTAYCAPVVYYSTMAREDFYKEVDDNSLNDDYASVDATYTDSNGNTQKIWVLASEYEKENDDLSEVTAVLVDCSKDADGYDFVLSGTVQFSISINMQAPSAETYTDSDGNSLLESIYETYARNEGYVYKTLDSANTHLSDTARVSLKDVTDVEIDKSSDLESGTEDSPADVGEGNSLTYLISVTNTNDSDTMNNIVVEDLISEYLEIDFSNIKVAFTYSTSDEETESSTEDAFDSEEETDGETETSTADIISSLSAVSIDSAARVDYTASEADGGELLTFTVSYLRAGETLYIIIPVTALTSGVTVENTAEITSVEGTDVEISSPSTYHRIISSVLPQTGSAALIILAAAIIASGSAAFALRPGKRRRRRN